MTRQLLFISDVLFQRAQISSTNSFRVHLPKLTATYTASDRFALKLILHLKVLIDCCYAEFSESGHGGETLVCPFEVQNEVSENVWVIPLMEKG